MNPISDSAPTADEALQRLKAGNERLIAESGSKVIHGTATDPAPRMYEAIRNRVPRGLRSADR